MFTLIGIRYFMIWIWKFDPAKTGLLWVLTDLGRATLLRTIYGDLPCAFGGEIDRTREGRRLDVREARKSMNIVSALFQIAFLGAYSVRGSGGERPFLQCGFALGTQPAAAEAGRRESACFWPCRFGRSGVPHSFLWPTAQGAHCQGPGRQTFAATSRRTIGWTRSDEQVNSASHLGRKLSRAWNRSHDGLSSSRRLSPGDDPSAGYEGRTYRLPGQALTGSEKARRGIQILSFGSDWKTPERTSQVGSAPNVGRRLEWSYGVTDLQKDVIS